MTTASLSGEVIVSFYAVASCLAPAITRPTVPFGVRVPPERASAPVIRQQRRAYYGRTAIIGACCIALVILLQDRGSWWLSRIILLAEIVADLGCFLIARNRIAAVKQAERWYAGHRQVVATDTSWRTDPPRFPVRWLIPALTVIAVTVLVGTLRYPHLPARVTAGGHLVPKSVVSVFGIVAAQLYVTAMWTGIMLIVYRSRPDIEAADAAGSTRRYRRFLAACTRAVLTLLALVDLTLLLPAELAGLPARRDRFGPAGTAVRGRPARPGRGLFPRGPRRIPATRRRPRRLWSGGGGRPGRRPLLEGRPDLRQP